MHAQQLTVLYFISSSKVLFQKQKQQLKGTKANQRMIATAAFRQVGITRGTVRLLEKSFVASNGRVLDVVSGCVGLPSIHSKSNTNLWKDRDSHSGSLNSVRWFSTTSSSPPPKNDKEENDDSSGGNIITKTFRSVLTPKNQFYFLLGGGVIVSYGVSRIFLSFTSFFTHLTPTVIAKWGFYTGFSFASCKITLTFFLYIFVSWFCLLDLTLN